MKFPTQHIKVKANGNRPAYAVHRQGNQTWITSGSNLAVSETITHKTRADAKHYMATAARSAK
jgi:hypothetical protein